MRTVTHEEVVDCMERVRGMTKNQTRAFMRRMQKEQPYLVVYTAAICERGEFEDDDDADAFVSLVATVWLAMRTAAGGPLVTITANAVQQCEEQIMQLYGYAEGEPEADWPGTIATWMEGFNQRPLLEFVIKALLSPESPYAVTEQGSGIIFTYLKVVIDCLDSAELKTRH